MTPDEIIDAIQARIKGEWDNENLRVFGPLSTDALADILAIIERASPAADYDDERDGS